MKLSRLIALFLALALLLSACAAPIEAIPEAEPSSSSALSGESEPESKSESESESEPVSVPAIKPAAVPWESVRAGRMSTWETFSDLKYERPDTAALAAMIADTQAMVEEGAPAEEVLDAVDTICGLFEQCYTMYSLASVMYSIDMTDEYYSDEMTFLIDEDTLLSSSMNALTASVLASDLYGDAAKARWGEDTVWYTELQSGLYLSEMAELMSREQELNFEYDEQSMGFKADYEGEEIDLDDIIAGYYAGDFDYDGYIERYNAYVEQANAVMGAIYVEMVDVRTQIAQMAGYTSYTDYGYDKYGRDYSTEQTDEFNEAVKKYIVPLYLDLNDALYTEDSERLYTYQPTLEDTFAALGEQAEAFSPSMAEAFHGLLDRKLYDLEPSDVKQSGAFATSLSYFGVPFLFASFDGSYQGVVSIIHEFGHFNNYWCAEPKNVMQLDALDLAEVDSQGFELLMMAEYESFYGDLANAARAEMIKSALYSLVSGCLVDEFERAVYDNPDMTLDEINVMYGQIAAEYGYDELYGRNNYDWVSIPHSFTSPLYYISYATSMVPALQLWSLSLQDKQGARERYLDFVETRGHAGYSKTLEAFDLTVPFGTEVVSDLAAVIEDYARNVLL